MGNRLPFRNTEGEFLYALSVPSGQLPRGGAQTVYKKLFSPERGRIALSANERIAEFLNIAIQAQFAYVNKLSSPEGGSQGAFADVEVKNTFSEGQTDEILSAE